MADVAGLLADALRARAEALQAQLLAAVEANLSGGVLQTRSGALKASVLASLSFDGETLEAAVGSDLAYAAIQEHGGTTPAHDIVPVKAQALAFAGAGKAGGGTAFARRVHHPGSTIPGRAPFGRALDATAGAIGAGLKEAVLASLGAD